MKILNNYILPLLILFIILFDPIFYAYTSYMNITVESGMKQYEAIGIAIAVYSIMFYNFLSLKIDKSLITILLVLLIILLLYLTTSIFYQDVPRLYYSQILLYGAVCIPSAYIGYLWAKNYDNITIDYILPFFTILLTLILVSVGFSVATKSELLKDERGLNYQSISYFFAFLYAYNAYFILFSKLNKTVFHKIMTIPIIFIMMLDATGCLISGGRGAFVFIIIISIYVIRSFYKSDISLLSKLFTSFILIILAFLIIHHFNITNTTGFERVTQRFYDEGRVENWEKTIHIFLESPIWGHGLGSIWWTLGFYSHNIFTDLLAETGILGFFYALFILFKTIKNIIFHITSNYSLIVISIILFTALIENLFSGYWITSYNMFFAIAFVYTYNNINSNRAKML